ncbi:MAG: T9SS type A sorting domain-containing protein [Bacteroidia bacterium]|jgi:hypothetical protein|nr:T9SS type A sorting domain-containing protein [Bacteroidia bacterium]
MKIILHKAFFLFLFISYFHVSKAQDRWTLLNCIDSNSYIFDMMGVNDTLFYSVESNTLARSYDGGKSWTRIFTVPSSRVNDYKYAFAYSRLYSVNGADYTFRRYTGTNWVWDTAGLNGSKPINVWAFDNRMFLATLFNTDFCLYTRNSPTAGWAKVANIDINIIADDFRMVKSGNSFYGYSPTRGIITSTTGSVFTQVTGTTYPKSFVDFVATNNALYISSNAASGPTIYKSTDGGSTWTQIGPFKNTFTTVGILFSDGNRLFTTENLGLSPDIYVSSNEGSTWSNISDTFSSNGIPREITGMAKYKNVIVASQGTKGGGVRNCVKQYGSLTTGLNTITPTATIKAAYPNPASRYLHVDLALSVPVKEIEILNLQGQRVMLLQVAEEFASNSIAVNIESLEQGMYFVKVDNSLQKFVKQ